MSSLSWLLQLAYHQGQLAGIKNCHVRGLDSITINSHKLRVYITRPDHELWLNDGLHRMSLAIHSHHCDLTLAIVSGQMRNLRYKIDDEGGLPFHECAYRSAINNGNGGITPTGRTVNLSLLEHKGAQLTQSMKAGELHTVLVPRHERACWLVVEGPEDPSYEPVCYTNNPVFNTEGMYVPMTKEEIHAHVFYPEG